MQRPTAQTTAGRVSDRPPATSRSTHVAGPRVSGPATKQASRRTSGRSARTRRRRARHHSPCASSPQSGSASKAATGRRTVEAPIVAITRLEGVKSSQVILMTDRSHLNSHFDKKNNVDTKNYYGCLSIMSTYTNYKDRDIKYSQSSLFDLVQTRRLPQSLHSPQKSTHLMTKVAFEWSLVAVTDGMLLEIPYAFE